MPYTPEQIERAVERTTDRIDADFMRGKMTAEQYEIAIGELNDWADEQYDAARRSH